MRLLHRPSGGCDGLGGNRGWHVSGHGIHGSNDRRLEPGKQLAQPADSGASFEIKEDKLYVKKVDVGSPAWEAGLVPGDEVVSFHFKGDPKPLAGGPEAWQKQLQNPGAGRRTWFSAQRDGKATPLATSVRQRPLWRFFPTPAGEWVLWMWQGSYYDTSTKGDFSTSAGMSTGPDFTHEPAFYRAASPRTTSCQCSKHAATNTGPNQNRT